MDFFPSLLNEWGIFVLCVVYIYICVCGVCACGLPHKNIFLLNILLLGWFFFFRLSVDGRTIEQTLSNRMVLGIMILA